MSETLQTPAIDESLRIHDQELAYLGATVTEAAMRSDLEAVAAAHVSATGVANPNSVPSEESVGFSIGSAEIPMSGESVYRQVHAAAIGDLATSGIVRNGWTAEGGGEPRWGDRVFWNSGKEGRNTSLGGRTVIEADKETARSGWVTADKVTGIYARDTDGQIKNLLR